MGVDLSLVVRNRFAQRENRKETLKKLQEVKALLDDNFGEGYFCIVDDEDNDYIYIADNR